MNQFFWKVSRDYTLKINMKAMKKKKPFLVADLYAQHFMNTYNCVIVSYSNTETSNTQPLPL